MELDNKKVLALGPQGPLVEEFWQNCSKIRSLWIYSEYWCPLHYYFAYIWVAEEPISAILLLMILGATIFIISQVLSAVVGVTEFNYSFGFSIQTYVSTYFWIFELIRTFNLWVFALLCQAATNAGLSTICLWTRVKLIKLTVTIDNYGNRYQASIVHFPFLLRNQSGFLS